MLTAAAAQRRTRRAAPWKRCPRASEGGTDILAPLQKACQMLKADGRPGAPGHGNLPFVFLFTDGWRWRGVARRAATPRRAAGADPPPLPRGMVTTPPPDLRTCAM
eukprot:gene8202-18280_t